MGHVYPRVGLDCVGLGQNFSTFNESSWDGYNCKKCVKLYQYNFYCISTLSASFFCRVWFCWLQNSWVAWVGLGLFDPGLGRVGSRELDPWSYLGSINEKLIHCNPLTQKGASYAYQQKWISFPLQLSGTETTLVSHKMPHSGSGCSIAASPVLTAPRVPVSAASLCLTVHELT